MAGTGTAALASGTGSGSGFALQEHYTTNWWTPPSASSGWTEQEGDLRADWTAEGEGCGRVRLEWDDSTDRAAVQGVGACLPGTSVNVWQSGPHRTMALGPSFRDQPGEGLAIVVRRDRTYSTAPFRLST